MSKKLAFVNANIITMNPDQPQAEAIGMAGESISIVGSTADVLAWAGEGAKVVDVGGKTITPGLIESHNHISIGSVFASYANCSSVTCANIEDALNAIAASVAKTPAGEWVQGMGYDDTAIAEMRHLTRHDLDAISTEHPIYISHVSGHLGYLNSMALEKAGIDASTPDPSGGSIDKEADGVTPSGLLLENAAFGVRAIIPEATREEFKKLFVEQIAFFNSVGVTSTHDAAVGMLGDATDLAAVCRELEKDGQMNVRIYTALVEEAYNRYDAMGMAKGFGSHYFKVGGVKYFQDGSIQGFTGALLDDYHTRPGWRGELIYPQEVLNEKFAYHQKNGDHIVVHGNGDAAVESILQAFELANEAYPREDSRHMMIHGQMAHDDHIDRMKKLGVIPSYFINHIYFWGDRHKALFIGPERAARMNPLGTSLKKGLIFSIHCDFPITPIDPMFIMHTAVNRHTRSGETLGPDERISALDALRTFTTWAALCSFEEDVKGSLEVGKLADLVVMDENMLEVAPETIKDIAILKTVVGGRIVFEK